MTKRQDRVFDTLSLALELALTVVPAMAIVYGWEAARWDGVLSAVMITGSAYFLGRVQAMRGLDHLQRDAIEALKRCTPKDGEQP